MNNEFWIYNKNEFQTKKSDTFVVTKFHLRNEFEFHILK